MDCDSTTKINQAINIIKSTKRQMAHALNALWSKCYELASILFLEFVGINTFYTHINLNDGSENLKHIKIYS